MFLLSTHNAAAHLEHGRAALRRGATAIDAVEVVIRRVEADPAEHTVGVGGYPNLVGEVELDASLMRGSDRATGAVGALKGYPHPISVARKVMELTPHVLLVGEGAGTFARETGFTPAETLTPEVARIWAERVEANLPPEARAELDARRSLLPYALLARDPARIHGTVNVIARDGRGDLACGVSTSGWAWKYPGRLGDSPVIGAGSYCDNRFGAAACTGHGERAIRAGVARAVVMHMEYGATPRVAAGRALEDARLLDPEGATVLVVLAVSPAGDWVCLTDSPRGWGCAWLDDVMGAPLSSAPTVHPGRG